MRKNVVYTMIILAVLGLTSACGKKKKTAANNPNKPAPQKPTPPPGNGGKTFKAEDVAKDLLQIAVVGGELFDSDLVLIFEGQAYKGLGRFAKAEAQAKAVENAKKWIQQATNIKTKYAGSIFIDFGSNKVLSKKLNPAKMAELEKIQGELKAYADKPEVDQGEKQGTKDDLIKKLSELYNGDSMFVEEKADAAKKDGKATLYSLVGPANQEVRRGEPPINPPGTN